MGAGKNLLRIQIERESRELGNIQSCSAQPLSRKIFVTANVRGFGRVVREIQRPGRTSCRGSWAIAEGNNSIDARSAGILHNLPRRIVWIFKAQRECPILPGIFQHVTAIGAEDNAQPQFIRSLDECPSLVTCGRTQDQKPLRLICVIARVIHSTSASRPALISTKVFYFLLFCPAKPALPRYSRGPTGPRWVLLSNTTAHSNKGWQRGKRLLANHECPPLNCPSSCALCSTRD